MSRLRRALTVAAVVATLAGLPAVLLAGALLRHLAHVSPSVTNAAALRLRLLGHGIACATPRPDPPAPVEATALVCAGPDGRSLRLVTYRNPRAQEAAPRPEGWNVDGANWRVQVGPGDAARPLADRLARALTGHASATQP